MPGKVYFYYGMKNTMNRDPLINFIKSNLNAPHDIVLYIANQFEEKVYAKNDYFLKEGKVSNDYLFLVEGFMRAYTIDTEGNEVSTYFYPTNRVVLEVTSFFMRIASMETIQALTDCKAFHLTFDQLNNLFHTLPEFREFGRKILVKEFSAYKQRTLSLINKTAEERYAELLDSNPEIFKHAQLKHIASYLGVTDTSLSRIRREFSKKD